MVFFDFWIFLLFFWNFLFHVGKERNGVIIFIFSLSQHFPTYFGLEWSRNGIFQFLNFFAIFLEFSLARREGSKRSDNFYFLSFSALSNLFCHEMKPQWYFLISWIFLLFFWNFLLSFGKERNKTIVFIILLSQLFPTYFGLERSRNGIFQFLNFFAIFMEFSLPGRVGTKRSDNFYFLSFSAFSLVFWLGMNP